MGKYFLQFVYWVGKSFEDPTKRVSSRRLLAFSIFHICYATSRLVFIFTVKEATDLLYGSALDALFILVLYGIVNMSDIAALKNGTKVNPKPENDENK